MKVQKKTVHWFLIITIALIVATSPGCSLSEQKSITVSIAPLISLTEAIAGDSWHVYSLVPPRNNPDDYELTIKDVMHLEDSQVVFYLSLPAEMSTLEKIHTNNPDKLLVNLTEQSAQWLEPIHITGTQLDPHIWLSPKRVIYISEIIRDTLISLDPDNTNTYMENQIQLSSKLLILHQNWENSLMDNHNQTFLIYHPALSYLALDYGLEMISIEQHGKEPNLKSLDKTILLAKQKGIDTVFYQQEFPRENAATIASEIGATAVPLSLLDENYFDMMNNLLEIFDDIL